ncbi:MAG: aspartyl protease family protein [Candidatus Acidiferrales bacterium]
MKRNFTRFFLVFELVFSSVAVVAHGQGASATPQPPTAGSGAPPPASPAHPSAPPSIVDADHLYRIDNLDAALAAYQALIATNSQTALAYAGISRVYLKQKKPADAYTASAKAVELAPTDHATRVAMAEVLFRQGKVNAAEKEFVALIQANTPNARAFLGEARISYANSHFKQAKRMIDKAHELDPDDPDISNFWFKTFMGSKGVKVVHVHSSDEDNEDARVEAAQERELNALVEKLNQQNGACRLKTKLTAMQTNLKQLLYDPRYLRGFGLNVKLNGTTAALLLDTGASGILVNRKIAEKAGIQRVFETKIGGIGDKGDAGGYYGRVDSIKIGDLEFQDCLVEVIDKKSAVDEEGLIGADVFSQFLVDLDFANNKFRLSELPRRPGETDAPAAGLESHASEAPKPFDRYVAPEMKSYTPVLHIGHMLLVPTKLNDGSPKLFLLDSGAFNNTISPSAAREVTKVYGDNDTQVKGLSGKVDKVFRGDQLTLAFGRFRQKNLDIVAFDTTRLSDSAGVEISGMLGFGLLRMLDVKIDYRDGLVDFEFDSKLWH